MRAASGPCSPDRHAVEEPWSAQMRRRPERRPLTRPDHTEFGPLRPGDLRRSGSGERHECWLANGRRLCGRYHCRPIETVIAHLRPYALADVVGLLLLEAPVAARAGEKRGDALVPMGAFPWVAARNSRFLVKRISLIPPETAVLVGQTNAPYQGLAGQFP